MFLYFAVLACSRSTWAKTDEEKDWNKSDALRDQLLEKGIEVKDSPSGVIWTYAPN
jgi:cysteinyl-tRNA synthetase